MRQIKFREYRGDGRWHYWGLMDEGKFVGPCSPNSIAHQFTGLLDKNGKEIYEGDVIKWCFVNTGDSTYEDIYYTEPVEWNDCGFFLDGGAPLTVAMDDCEVIGNIYENTELLKP